ncbi:MAG: cohesin domain-containing protein, partial [Bacteroidota bacterium]
YNSAFDDAGSPVLINEDSNGDIRIIWVDNLLNGVTLPDGATVITLCFNVLNDGQTNVALSGTPIPVIGSNVSGNSVDIIVNGGVVNGSGQQPTCSDGIQNGNETGVDCGGPDCAPCMVMGDCSDGQQNGQETGVDCGGPDCSPCTTDLVFDLVNASCDGDGNACVDLITTGFTSITGFQFMVNFDETAMTYVDFTPNPIFASSGSPVTTFSSVPGVIQALFVDGTTEFDGITLDDLTVVGTFCFSNVADGNTDLSISGIVATDDSGMAIPAQGFGATVSCGGDVPTCSDGIQNGNETGVDCGGPDCAPCPPSCSDGIQNGDEEGVDCGGSSCSPCMTMADCNDGQQNGQETGVDCGGPDCNPCTTDLVFDLVNATCDGDGNACVDLITTGFSSITGFQFAVNYDETAMTYDNFTANPVFAAMGSPVTVFSSTPGTIQALFVDGTTEFDGITLDDFTVIGTFCFSSVADGNTDLSISGIVATDDSGSAIPAQGFGATVSCGGDVPTCNDGIQNGNETGVDCGGPDCAPCPPTCDDGIQNGDEEGIDCGGSSCMPCMSEPTCDDGIQNGQETGVDCGGPDCTPCTTDLVFDLVDSSCDGDGNACVTMITTGFVSITGFQFAVNYDETAMTYDNFTANPVFAAMGSPVTAFSSTPGTIQALFVDGTAEFNGITLNPLDTIGTFCFSNVADGTTDLTITGIVATDDTGSPIPAQGFGATVSCGDVTEPTCNDGIQNGNETGVDCGGPDCDPCDTCDNGVQDGNETGVDCGGDCNACETDITFTLTNGTGAVGTQVCLDVVTFDFNEVTGFQFSLAYDPSLLQFMSATGVSQLPGLMATSGSPGQISVDWDGSSPVTIGNGGEVLEVCFMVLGPDVCTADVTFSNTPTPIGADNVNNDIVTVFTNNGVINSGNPCGDPPPNLVLDIGDANGGEGSEICLDVTVENFIDLTDLQFSATFDPSILTFDGGGDFNLAGLSNANFGNPTPGVITFSWENPGPGGVTVSDGTAIFSLCFTINTVAETVVQPSNTPTAIFAMNGMNQSVGVVPSAGIVNAGVPTTDGLTFIIGAGSGSVGETVCIPVTVFNFEALAGLQFSVDYDPSLVQFDNGAADPCPLSGGPIFDCLPGFLPNNNINSPTPGEIRISWEDQALSDRQVADGSTIFELCFTVLSDECAAISFGTAIAVQFFNANLELMPATLVNGSINCTAAPMIVDADVQSPSCDVDTDGSIDLTVLGGGNLTYSWTPDVGDGPLVENLSPGIYTVIITNPSTGQSTSATYTVEQAPSFAITTTDVTDVRCNGESNGSITIATNGGIAPYIIDWSGNLQDGLLQQNNL